MQKFHGSRNVIGILPLLAIVFLMCSSCTDTRKITYMQGSFDTARLSQVHLSDPVIQPGDMLSIIVYSDNPSATAFYNQYLSGASGAAKGSDATSGGDAGGSSPASPGYLVDEKGDIQFQSLGRMHVAGLTKNDLNDTLVSRLQDTGYLLHPYITIRFLNYRFSMLGEVTKPGVYSLPGDHISILEALGMAGDITPFGRRDNVTVIRTIDGKREFARLDLLKPEIMASPYFYLQQDDLVIVAPNKSKAASSDLTLRNITIVSAVITTLALVISLLR
jgi:polysaccharide export outer membrane protein